MLDRVNKHDRQFGIVLPFKLMTKTRLGKRLGADAISSRTL